MKVSIPLWFDSNGGGREKGLETVPVSIPLWFDSNCANSFNNDYTQVVSIPLWFDSNLLKDTSDFPLSNCLNSTMVRFKF